MGITNNIPPSRLIQPGVIDNTAARPASPFEGQAVYQKDTDQVLFWSGTAWVETASMLTKAPRGVIANSERTTDVLLGPVFSTLLTITFTLNSSRQISLVGNVPWTGGASTTNFLDVELKQGATIYNVSSHRLDDSTDRKATIVTRLVTLPAGSHTINLTAAVHVGSATCYGGTRVMTLTAYDMGGA